jgi:predicted AAA+ superfamily ATPase
VTIIVRDLVPRILERLSSPPPLVQVLAGARQVGKTTAALQVADRWGGPVRYAAADQALPPGPEWIETQWHLARRDRKTKEGTPLLILDEVQKVPRWSEVVKALWDEDRREKADIGVLLLGSSALLLAEGTTESLAGRFFLHRASHWTWPETREAFGWDLDRWLYFGGYPGAALLADDEPAWRSYVQDSLIETVISRDVLALHTVRKPALLRNLFLLAARFRGEILSYNKMLGQLTDAGNTVTLAHYLELLGTAFLVTGLQRYSAGRARSRGSSPKLVLWNNALATALGPTSFEQARADPALWGRLVDNAVGAHLLNHLGGLTNEITYWRERNDEVDYVVETGGALWALEVKSGRPRRVVGLKAFRRQHPRAQALVIGTGGMPLDEFFQSDPRDVL